MAWPLLPLQVAGCRLQNEERHVRHDASLHCAAAAAASSDPRTEESGAAQEERRRANRFRGLDLRDPTSHDEVDEAGAKPEAWVRTFESVGAGDVAEVGGKNASLGEMIGALCQRGIRVPRGFATTAAAYRQFVEQNALEAEIEAAEHEERGDALRRRLRRPSKG